MKDISDERKGRSEILDITRIVETCHQKWYGARISHVNDSVLRLGTLEGEFHLHHHNKEDKFFYVISGRLLLDLLSGTIELKRKVGLHSAERVQDVTRSSEKTIVLIVER